MKRRDTGFTLIEIVTVIVIISILAAITIASYNSMTQRSRDTARLAELTEVDRLIESYRVMNGHYPLDATDMVPNTIYCVGTGFPGGRCWPLNQMGMPGGAETDMRVTTKLLTVGNLPSGHFLVDGVGTHIWIISPTSFELDGSFEGSTCPPNFGITEDYSGHTQCIKDYTLN